MNDENESSLEDENKDSQVEKVAAIRNEDENIEVVTTQAEQTRASSLFVESQHKILNTSQDNNDQIERSSSAGRRRSPTQDKILQKLDETAKDVSYFRNIISFDDEIKQSFPHRSDSETGRILERLKEATTAAEKESQRKKQDDATFSTSLSEEELEKARIRRERRRVEQETMLWKDDPNKTRIKMEELIEDKVHQHYSRGIVQASEGRFEAAVTSFSKALNLQPSDTSCYVERGEAFLQLCDFRSAYLNYKKAHSLEPDNPHLIIKLAFICYLEGQCLFDQALYAEALECFVRAAELKPGAKGYHLRAITCLAALGRNQECLALVTRRLETEATANPELYVLRARLHQQFGNATLCYYDVRDALSLDPDQLQAREMMEEINQKASSAKQQALEYTIQGKLNEALSKMATAVQTDPSMADYHVLRGALHRRMKNFNSAIDDYLLGMDKSDHDETNPSYQAAQRQLLLTYNDFAVHCYHKGFYEEAIILLNKAIKGEKEEKGIYVNRGDCFFKLNNLGFALADYQQALELDPGCWATRCRLSVVQNEFGISAYQERMYDDAIDYFSLAIQHNNKVGQFYVHRARALYMTEEVEGARADILTALHLDPDNDEMIPLLSRLFPGRSVSEVLQSKMAEEIRNQLASTVASSSKLSSVSRQTSSISRNNLSKLSSTTNSIVPNIPEIGEGGSGVVCMELAAPSARHLPTDKEYLQDKKKIARNLKEIFNFPMNLTSKQPKVLSSVPNNIGSRPIPSSTSKWRSVGSNSFLL